METYFYILSLASSSDSVCSGTSTCDWHTYSQIPIKVDNSQSYYNGVVFIKDMLYPTKLCHAEAEAVAVVVEGHKTDSDRPSRCGSFLFHSLLPLPFYIQSPAVYSIIIAELANAGDSCR